MSIQRPRSGSTASSRSSPPLLAVLDSADPHASKPILPRHLRRRSRPGPGAGDARATALQPRDQLELRTVLERFCDWVGSVEASAFLSLRFPQPLEQKRRGPDPCHFVAKPSPGRHRPGRSSRCPGSIPPGGSYDEADIRGSDRTRTERTRVPDRPLGSTLWSWKADRGRIVNRVRIYCILIRHGGRDGGTGRYSSRESRSREVRIRGVRGGGRADSQDVLDDVGNRGRLRISCRSGSGETLQSDVHELQAFIARLDRRHLGSQSAQDGGRIGCGSEVGRFRRR